VQRLRPPGLPQVQGPPGGPHRPPGGPGVRQDPSTGAPACSPACLPACPPVRRQHAVCEYVPIPLVHPHTLFTQSLHPPSWLQPHAAPDDDPDVKLFILENRGAARHAADAVSSDGMTVLFAAYLSACLDSAVLMCGATARCLSLVWSVVAEPVVARIGSSPTQPRFHQRDCPSYSSPVASVSLLLFLWWTRSGLCCCPVSSLLHRDIVNTLHLR
jgi:hypothetical protein